MSFKHSNLQKPQKTNSSEHAQVKLMLLIVLGKNKTFQNHVDMIHSNVTHVSEHAEQDSYNNICHVMFMSIHHVV